MRLATLVSVLILGALAAPLKAQEPDFAAAGDEAVRPLQDLIRVNTSSPPGNETQAARFIRSVLDEEDIASHIYEKEPGRGNLVARIRGTGSKRPIVLMGHIDVVGVEEDKWSVDPFAAVIEGGGMLSRDGAVRQVNVATTEKVGARMKLTARGTSGHGSRPRPDNAVVHLATAVARFGTWQPPMRLNETTREYFRRMARVVDEGRAFLYRHIEDPDLTEMVQEKLRLTDLAANSTLRTSISPTIIEGGFRRNVIPAEASAILDIRALPDEDVEWLEAEMARVIDDPDAVTIPTMLTGATDSAQLRAAGVLMYGIGTVTDEATGSRAHGNDERTPVAGVGQLVEFLYPTVLEVAGP